MMLPCPIIIYNKHDTNTFFKKGLIIYKSMYPLSWGIPESTNAHLMLLN
uniref:Uncharacterized protein n=1 Tax=Arundo donax TaxID=35708 RepID=A0A0A9GR31_ARUDO